MAPRARCWHCCSPARLLLALALLLRATAAASAQTLPPPPPRPDTTQLAVLRTASGVRYGFHVRGTGALPLPGQRVVMGYTAFLPDGRVFDASSMQGGMLKFRVGRHEVITGLDEATLLLPVGSRARIWIPAALGYAAKGVHDPDDDTRYIVPPGTDLVFEVVVVGVR